MPEATRDQRIALRYGEASPLGAGQPLTQKLMQHSSKLPQPWFQSGVAEGYIDDLITRFETAHPEAAEDLLWILNEAKWSVGFKGFCRQLEERLA